MNPMLRSLGVLVAVFVPIAVLGPLVLSDYRLGVAVNMLAVAYIATAWNLMGGFTGLFSLGHIAFVGIGAYTTTILQVRSGVSPWVGMLVGAALAAVLAFVVGFVSYRTRQSHASLALLTLVIAQLAFVLAGKLEITEATRGIAIPLQPGIAHMQFGSERGYFFFALALVAFVVGFAAVLRYSRFGYRLLAIRENERVAEGIGIPTLRYKLAITTVSGALSAIGGVLIAQHTLFVDPDSAFSVFKSLEIPVYALVGGFGSAFGPLVGAALMTLVSEALRPVLSDVGAGLDLVVFGAVLMVVVLVAPQGVLGYASALARSLGARIGASRLRAAKLLRPSWMRVGR